MPSQFSFQSTLVLLPTPKRSQPLLEKARSFHQRLLRAQASRLEPAQLACYFGYSGSLARLKASLSQSAISAEQRLLCMDFASLMVEPNGVRALGLGPMLGDPPPKVLSMLTDHFAEQGASLIDLSGSECLLAIPDSWPALDAKSSDDLLGSSVQTMMPSSIFWQKQLNEVQMLLASLPADLHWRANSAWFYDIELQAAGSSRGVVLHNDSTDKTLQALSHWSEQQPSKSATTIIDARTQTDWDTELPAELDALSNFDVLFANGQLRRSKALDALMFWRKKTELS